MPVDAADGFWLDLEPPRVQIHVTFPDGVLSTTIGFTESVWRFDIDDFELTRDGQVIALEGVTLQAMGTNSIFRLFGLGALATEPGEYRLELIASTSGIADFAGNALVQNAVEEFSIVGRTCDFNPQDRSPVVIAHRQVMQLATGTIAFSFTADNAGATLLSKDARGTANGDLQISYIRQGDSNRVRVQFVQAGRTHTLTSHSLQNGVQNNLELKFGQGRLRLFINSRLMGRNSGATGGLVNQQDLVLGASNAGSTRGTNDRFTSFFDGRIGGLRILDAAGEVVFSDVAAR